MTKRNSLIEFYRFFFALNVVKNHGYFPYQGPYFSPGRISVEFFFVLSGWLMVKSIDKYTNKTYWRGLGCLIRDKLYILGIPLIVGLVFNVIHECIVGVDTWYNFNIWVYLWYVHDMFIVFIVYYTLRKYIKSKKVFLWVTFGIFLITAIMHSVPTFYAWGYFRAFSAMSIGVLISFLPSIKTNSKWWIWVLLIIVWALILKMFLFDFSFVEDEILNYILYPALIYLTFQLPVDNCVFNYLGALSFGMYAYQSIPRVINVLGYNNTWVFFGIIMFLAIVTDIIKRIVNANKNPLYGNLKNKV